MELDATGKAGLTDEILASCTFGTISNQVRFDLAGGLASLDEGVHNLMNALLAFHHAAAIHHAEGLIQEAGLAVWYGNALGRAHQHREA